MRTGGIRQISSGHDDSLPPASPVSWQPRLCPSLSSCKLPHIIATVPVSSYGTVNDLGSSQFSAATATRKYYAQSMSMIDP